MSRVCTDYIQHSFCCKWYYVHYALFSFIQSAWIASKNRRKKSLFSHILWQRPLWLSSHCFLPFSGFDFWPPWKRTGSKVSFERSLCWLTSLTVKNLSLYRLVVKDVNYDLVSLLLFFFFRMKIILNKFWSFQSLRKLNRIKDKHFMQKNWSLQELSDSYPVFFNPSFFSNFKLFSKWFWNWNFQGLNRFKISFSNLNYE